MVPLKQDFARFAQTWDIHVFFKWLLDREKKTQKTAGKQRSELPATEQDWNQRPNDPREKARGRVFLGPQ